MGKLKEVDIEVGEIKRVNKLLKGVDNKTWYKLKLIAMENNLSMADALSYIIANFLKSN